MKRKITFAAVAFCVLCLVCVAASASGEVTVLIPDYECIIENSPVYYWDSLYPFISYKDITYFPMTYDYCRALDLSTSWDNEKGLYIVYQPSEPSKLPIYETTVNSKYLSAVLPEYPIYLNGKRIDNSELEYPLLNLRGVTYFPMTWEFAHEEFAWETKWENNTFCLETGLHAEESLNIEKYLSDGVVVSSVVSEDIPLESGGYTIKDTIKYYKYDYATGERHEIEYDPSAEENQFTYTSAKVTVTDGVAVFGEYVLPEVTVVTGGYGTKEIASISNDIWSRGYTLGGVQFYDITNNYSIWYEDGSGTIGRPVYSYIEADGKLYYIGKDLFVWQAAVSGDGNIYFNTRAQLKMIRTFTSLSSTLWRLCDGELECVNEEFPQWNSMEIIGSIDGRIYLRNVACPGYEYPMVVRDYYEVSAVDDGYFTYDGVGSIPQRIAEYVYADDSFVSPDGGIYVLVRWQGQIRKLEN